LRWWSCVDNVGTDSDADAGRLGSYTNTKSDSDAEPYTHPHADTDADSSLRRPLVVAELVAWCGKLQRLSFNDTFVWALKNWKRHGNEFHRHRRAGWPDLFLYADHGQ
jgi:hypothetical protein